MLFPISPRTLTCFGAFALTCGAVLDKSLTTNQPATVSAACMFALFVLTVISIEADFSKAASAYEAAAGSDLAPNPRQLPLATTADGFCSDNTPAALRQFPLPAAYTLRRPPTMQRITAQ
jgi:hypothetical protein